MKAQDRLFAERACELAARAIGNTLPNPPVGAVLVRDGTIIGEGYHHRAGMPHAETEAIVQAGDARDATLYVTLEPCNHTGKTPPCTKAVIESGIKRVVIGTMDPNPKTGSGGLDALRKAGIEVEVVDSARAKWLVEPFAHTIQDTTLPYVSVKMASSIDGFVASRPGEQQWLTGEASRDFVRDLRIAHDAVMVGAGTVRVDDPQLTVRPAHDRLRPYHRIVLCETDSVPVERRIFSATSAYERTIVVAPGGKRERFESLREVADVIFVGDGALALDLRAALEVLRAQGIQSILCEGGPTLAARLLTHGLVQRFFWLMAPVLLAGAEAVGVLNFPEGTLPPSIQFDDVERLGDDVLLSGTVGNV